MDRRYLARISSVLFAVLTLGAAACSDEARRNQADPVGTAELAERIGAGAAPAILDVRSREEYAAEHIPGAINIPHDELPSRLGELGIGKTEELIVHCGSGRRAEFAERLLIEAGYTNVRDLEGHMQAWRQAGYPTQ